MSISNFQSGGGCNCQSSSGGCSSCGGCTCSSDPCKELVCGCPPTVLIPTADDVCDERLQNLGQNSNVELLGTPPGSCCYKKLSKEDGFVVSSADGQTVSKQPCNLIEKSTELVIGLDGQPVTNSQGELSNSGITVHEVVVQDQKGCMQSTKFPNLGVKTILTGQGDGTAEFETVTEQAPCFNEDNIVDVNDAIGDIAVLEPDGTSPGETCLRRWNPSAAGPVFVDGNGKAIIGTIDEGEPFDPDAGFQLPAFPEGVADSDRPNWFLGFNTSGALTWNRLTTPDFSNVTILSGADAPTSTTNSFVYSPWVEITDPLLRFVLVNWQDGAPNSYQGTCRIEDSIDGVTTGITLFQDTRGTGGVGGDDPQFFIAPLRSYRYIRVGVASGIVATVKGLR